MTTPVWGTSIFLPLVASAVSPRGGKPSHARARRANGCTGTHSHRSVEAMAPLVQAAAAMIAKPPPAPAPVPPKNSVALLPPGAKRGGRRFRDFVVLLCCC
uniref:Secreted protein n=1 Tax=Oryza brachyantha TaxID=4533 RepID=J3MZ86_ORYBR